MNCRICKKECEPQWPGGGVCDDCYHTMECPPRFKLRVKRLRDEAIMPTYATDGSAGLDLYCCSGKPIRLEFGDEPVAVDTGISVEIPFGYVGLIKGRSGLAFGSGVFGFDGVIDSDYRGEIRVLLTNRGRRTQKYYSGQRIAQMIIAPVQKFELVEVCSLTNTERGENGFGSTGKS